MFRTSNAHATAGTFIGDRVMLFDGVRLLLGEADTRLVIGSGTVVNVNCYLSGEGGLEINEEVLIGAHAKLLSAGHEIHAGDPVIARNPIVGAPIRVGRGQRPGQSRLGTVFATACRRWSDLRKALR